MTEDDLRKLINDRIGYQAYLTTTYKPFEQPQPSANPFGVHSQFPKDAWFLYQAEVGITTLFGPQAMGKGKTFDLTFADLKKNHPYLFP